LAFALCLLVGAASTMVWNLRSREQRQLAGHQADRLAADPNLLLAVLEGDRDSVGAQCEREVAANPAVVELAVYGLDQDGGGRLLHAAARNGAAHAPSQLPIPAAVVENDGLLTRPLLLPANARASREPNPAPVGVLLLSADTHGAAVAAAATAFWLGVAALGILLLAALAALRPGAHAVARRNDRVGRTGIDVEAQVADRTAALRAKLDELQTLDKAKDRFLSGMSHEMRTPLTTIMAAAEILTNLGDGDQAARAEFAAMIQHEARRLNDRVDDVIDLAKLEAHTFELQIEDHDLCRLARHAVAAAQKVAAVSGVKVAITAPDGALLQACDGYRISRALRALLTNAIAHSPRNATVDLDLRAEDGQRIVSVRDRGPGVPADVLATALNGSLQQTTLARGSTHQGLGIGLPLASQYVRAHGGALRHAAPADGGAVFSIQLPARTSVGVAKAAAGTPAAAGG
jgi:signal transduction histidine kinase